MPALGNISITVADNGASNVIVPASSVQAVFGCSSIGTAAQPIATRNLATLSSVYGVGPLVEAAALAILKGGTVIATKVAQNTAGAQNAVQFVGTGTSVVTAVGNATDTYQFVFKVTNGGTIGVAGIQFQISLDAGRNFGPIQSLGTQSDWATTHPNAPTFNIATASAATPPVVTTTANHGYANNQVVVISGVTGNAAANGTFKITVTGNTTFTLQTLTGSNVVGAGAGTGGTVNAGIGFGLHFAAGTLVTGDTAKLQTTEPLWNTANVSTAFTALKNSAFAQTGWGSMHLVGGSTSGGVPGADCATIEGYLDTFAATNFLYTRLFMSARDASAPSAYGGSGETDSAWSTAILADYTSTSAIRCTVGAAYWNMPSAYPGAMFGSPRMRRSVSWAAAAKQVTVPPQRHLGRVADGALSNIVVDTVNDPLDGWNYHDERINPGLDYVYAGSGGRFMSTTTRVGLPGVYITNPITMAPFGSQFTQMMFGNVMDVACSITRQVGQQQINSDIRLNANGTIFENDASTIERAISGALNANMTSVGMLSPTGAVAKVDRTVNVALTNTVAIAVTLYGKGYILQENVVIAFSNPLSAS